MSAASNTASASPRVPPARSRAAALDSFRTWLREQGLRCTQERQEIAAAFLRTDRHVEAEELLLRMREAGSAVSRATIYRTLDLLVQAGLGRKVRLGTDHYYFEHVLGRGQHEHMICLECDRVIEWYDPELADLIRENLERHRFVARRYSVQVFGVCAECAAGRD